MYLFSFNPVSGKRVDNEFDRLIFFFTLDHNVHSSVRLLGGLFEGLSKAKLF